MTRDGVRGSGREGREALRSLLNGGGAPPGSGERGRTPVLVTVGEGLLEVGGEIHRVAAPPVAAALSPTFEYG